MSQTAQESWNVVTLSELGEFRNGVNYSREDEGEGLRLIKTDEKCKLVYEHVYDSYWGERQSAYTSISKYNGS